MKIAVITCYFDPDYVRARTIRSALKQVSGVKTVVVKNQRTGLLRYPEIIWKLWQMKRQEKPDVYLLTFRGQEILPFVLLLAGKKPVWFDEFIVPMAYVTGENHKKSFGIRVKYFLVRISDPLYRRWLRRCDAVFSDTEAHAELSARTSNMNLSKYLPLPVGADEKVFKPASSKSKKTLFQVFYYSSGMQPLHGLEVLLAAAVLLKDQTDIEFIVAGGKRPLARAVKLAQKQGARITYHKWIPFNELLSTIHGASLCLGGPFGNTQQAQHVITGKTYQFLAAQVPVVIGASETTSQYFWDKNNALVVPQADPEALTKAILWAYKHPELLNGIAANGRKLYDKEFSSAAISKILAGLVAST